jgi:hypothetical protein
LLILKRYSRIIFHAKLLHIKPNPVFYFSTNAQVYQLSINGFCISFIISIPGSQLLDFISRGFWQMNHTDFRFMTLNKLSAQFSFVVQSRDQIVVKFTVLGQLFIILGKIFIDDQLSLPFFPLHRL